MLAMVPTASMRLCTRIALTPRSCRPHRAVRLALFCVSAAQNSYSCTAEGKSMSAEISSQLARVSTCQAAQTCGEARTTSVLASAVLVEAVVATLHRWLTVSSSCRPLSRGMISSAAGGEMLAGSSQTAGRQSEDSPDTVSDSNVMADAARHCQQVSEPETFRSSPAFLRMHIKRSVKF